MPYGYGASQKHYEEKVKERQTGGYDRDDDKGGGSNEERQRREQARQPVIQKSRQPGLAASTPAKTIAPTLKADILEKEFKTASDDRFT